MSTTDRRTERTPLSAQDAAFLRVETAATPTHVAGIEEYRIPDGDPDFVTRLVETLVTQPAAPLWRRRLTSGRGMLPMTPAWEDDAHFDLDYHVRRVALPEPGSRAQLERLVERLHARPLDRDRPLWECYVIEGLAGDGRPGSRFAVYMKVSHALVDGMAGVGLAMGKLSVDADAPATAPWAVDAPPAETAPVPTASQRLGSLFRGATGLYRLGLEQSLDAGLRALTGAPTADLPLGVPPQSFNAAVDGERALATRSLPLARVRAVAKAADATVNDVALALTGAALRRWLEHRGELGSRSLSASCPVSVRSGAGVGNNVSMIIADLATETADPLERLARAKASARRGKRQLSGLSQGAAETWATMLALGGMASSIPGLAGRVPPPANLVVSNVPGPREPRWFAGAELVGYFPVSVVMHGQGLNVTLLSRAGGLDFGLTAARRCVPDLSVLADGLQIGLEALEAALGADLDTRRTALDATAAAPATVRGVA
jgi:WS/DGAT/MGAT family acyltransferase